jgi:medium-chain acyl-[acyl-carrier-protein] hydrolase
MDVLLDVDVWSVSLPGHTPGRGEPAFTDVHALVDHLARELAPSLVSPYAFFGHSMGALVSFELARKLRSLGGDGPVHMIVSGFRAPHLPDRRPAVHGLPDQDVEARLRELGGTPDEVLENSELMAVILPVLRADLELCERYVFEAGERLTCSMTAFSGSDDSQVTVEEVSAWRTQTVGSFSLRVFAGSHFFFNDSRRAVIQALARDIGEVLRCV